MLKTRLQEINSPLFCLKQLALYFWGKNCGFQLKRCGIKYLAYVVLNVYIGFQKGMVTSMELTISYKTIH